MLATAPPVFAYCTNNLSATPTAFGLDLGTAFDAGASGSDAAAVTLLSALTHDVCLVRLRIAGIYSVGNDSNAAGDLLIDPAGGTSWSVLIEDLVCGMSTVYGLAVLGTPTVYEFPLWIPAGASVGFRAKTAHTADITTGCVFTEVFGEPSRPEMWWCGQGVETIGISDSKGTAITSGNASWGSWTSVGSPTSRTIKSLQFQTNGSDATSAINDYYFQVGAGSSVLPGAPTLVTQMNASEYGGRLSTGPISCNVPAGTQLQVRGMSRTTVENIYVAAYGVY